MKTPAARAFSLIELLVVISIISVLISVLLPSLGAAREVAKSARCMSNQRQLSVGVHYYLNNNRAFYPVGTGWANQTELMNPSWGQVVAREIGIVGYVREQNYNPLPEYPQHLTTQSKPNNALFICPSYNRKNLWGGAPSNTYSWNNSATGMGDGDVWGNPRSTSYNTLAWWTAYGRRKESQVTRPSNTVMFREFFSNNPTTPLNYEYSPSFGGAKTITDLHNGTSNVAWVDGHSSTAAAPNTAFADTNFLFNQNN